MPLKLKKKSKGNPSFEMEVKEEKSKEKYPKRGERTASNKRKK